MLALSTDSLLFANLDNVFGFDGFVPRATLGIQELQELLKRLCIRGVSEEGALSLDAHQVFVPQLVEMV
jgi:hypothetical protein